MGQSNAPLVPLDQNSCEPRIFRGAPSSFPTAAEAHAPFCPAKGGRGRCTAPHRATPGGETRPPLWPLGPPDTVKGPPTPFPTITTPSGRLAANMLYQSFGKKPGGGADLPGDSRRLERQKGSRHVSFGLSYRKTAKNSDPRRQPETPSRH